MRIVMLFCLSVLSLASSIPASAEPLKSNSISITDLLKIARTASKTELWASDSVAEDKLSVYVDPSSVDKVEQGLDLLPGYQWISIKPADGTIYKVLGPDYIERSKWRSLADAADEEERRKVREFVEKRLSEYRAAMALTNDELQALAETDPRLVYDLTTPSFRVEIELLTSFNNEQLNQVLSPQGLKVNVRDLPADMQERFLDSKVRGMVDEPAKRLAKKYGANAPSAKELLKVFVNTGTLQFSGYGSGGFTVDIRSDVPLFGGYQSSIIGPTYTDNYWIYVLNLREKTMSREDAWDLWKAEEDHFDKLRTDAMAKEKETRFAEAPPRFGSRNAPDFKIDRQLLDKPVVEGYPYYRGVEFVQSVCSQKGCSLFALEPYRNRGLKATDDMQFRYALDLAMDSLGILKDYLGDYVWAYQDDQLILAPRHFEDRLAAGIPLSTINKLRAIAAKTNGTFDLDGLAEAVPLLNQRQIDALPENAPDDLRATGIDYVKEPAVRLYASLSPRRRVKACNGGVSYTVLENKQRALFYEALGRVVNAVDLLPEPSYFSVDDRDSQNGRYHLITFTFGFADETALPFDLRLPARKDNSKTAQSASKADAKAEPTQPQVLTVMKSLAEWNYIGRREHDDDNELKAIMYSQIGERPVKRILKVGETLEGAKLVEIGAKFVTFSLDGAQITFPITQATALAPFDPKVPSIYTSWIGIDETWTGILKKEKGE
ncbi:MAG: hypothetical protein ABFD46_07675 [Armatimonadota bacterium]